jgi:hypothetical protein
VLVKFSPEQAKVPRDGVYRLHPVLGVVCPGCGARIGKPCVATVPFLGTGSVGVPIEGVHAERIAAAREQGVA